MTQGEGGRLSIVETKIDAMVKTIDQISTTLDELKRVSIQNEDNRIRISALEKRMGEQETKVTDLKSWLESRWYVLVTAVVIAQVAIQAIFKILE